MNYLTTNRAWIILTLTLLITSACSRQQPPSVVEGEGFYGTQGFTRGDSLVSDIGDTRNYPRTLEVIDSLEQRGELTPAKSIFYRTIAYNQLGQRHTSLRLYAQLAAIDVTTLTTKADLLSYIYACNNYVRLLCDMKRYDRALREANSADGKLKTIGHTTFARHHDIAQMMGECQLYLGQEDQAAQSFHRALRGIRYRLGEHHDPIDYRECQKTVNAIVMAYIDTKHYQEATPWVAVQDSLLHAATLLPDRDTVFIDEMKADILYSQALLAWHQRQPRRAEQAYREYLSTHAAQQTGSIIHSTEYLMLTHRYDRAARHFSLLNQYLQQSGYETDLETIGRYMLPKYQAHLLARHPDSAALMASQIAQVYDSALLRQRAIDADLLTTFYDTEGKERQIAQQRAELSQQRLLTVMIGAAAFVIFFMIYAAQRRKAYRQLDATNRQLVKANERAEESSRMKTKFIRQITHEVRTPLNVLSGFSQVLADPDIDLSSSDLQSISRKIVANSERITHLMDKMLDLSQINSHADIECHDTMTAAEVARQAIELSGILRADHLQFRQQVPHEILSLRITTNRRAAVKSLAMLLDNAIKFTHPLAFTASHPRPHAKPHVTLIIRVAPSRVVFAVEDTGIGIPPEQAENIFTEFVQLDEYSDGTGIGLSIARSLVRQMKGDILLDTTYREGARFIMSLPG